MRNILKMPPPHEEASMSRAIEVLRKTGSEIFASVGAAVIVFTDGRR